MPQNVSFVGWCSLPGTLSAGLTGNLGSTRADLWASVSPGRFVWVLPEGLLQAAPCCSSVASRYQFCCLVVGFFCLFAFNIFILSPPPFTPVLVCQPQPESSSWWGEGEKATPQRGSLSALLLGQQMFRSVHNPQGNQTKWIERIFSFGSVFLGLLKGKHSDDTA